MPKLLTLALGISLCVLSCAVPMRAQDTQSAQNSKPPKTQKAQPGKSHTAAKASARKTTLAQAVTISGQSASATASEDATPSYEQLRQSLRAVRLHSLQEMRANITALEGRVVELKGVYKGVSATSQRRTFWLSLDEAKGVFVPLPEQQGLTVNMRALPLNSTVRVLAKVNLPTDGRDAVLSIIAATDQPEPTSLFKQQDDENALILVPSTDNVALPQPPPARPSTIPAQRPGLDDSTISDPEERVESQKPAYKALVLRFNRKLRDDQVDEIATALLTAGYANNIDPRFLAAIISVESDFDIYCLSSSGAMGLGQLMPFNLREAGITNAWNPTQNIVGTARLLRGHLNDYRGRSDQTLLAVAAYNAGPGAVRRAGYRVPPGHQVQRYVWKVYYRYKELAPDMFR